MAPSTRVWPSRVCTVIWPSSCSMVRMSTYPASVVSRVERLSCRPVFSGWATRLLLTAAICVRISLIWLTWSRISAFMRFSSLRRSAYRSLSMPVRLSAVPSSSVRAAVPPGSLATPSKPLQSESSTADSPSFSTCTNRDSMAVQLEVSVDQ